MRILWLNPVGTADHDAGIAALLARTKSPNSTASEVTSRNNAFVGQFGRGPSADNPMNLPSGANASV